MADMTDIVGTKVGKLQVVEYLGRFTAEGHKLSRPWYRCICDCGRECIARRDHLKEGRKKSCGKCFRIEEKDDCCVFHCATGGSFLFDKEDLPIVEQHSWGIQKKRGQGGYRFVTARHNGKIVVLSRLLLNVDEGAFVDHINGDALDNRRSNLRIVTPSENTRNQALRFNSLTGYKGVSTRSGHPGGYRAYICFDGKFKHLGYFDNPEDAARAYDKAARLYFGEFACVNFPLPGEQCCRRNLEASA